MTPSTSPTPCPTSSTSSPRAASSTPSSSPPSTRAMKLEDGGQEFTDRVVTVALVGDGRHHRRSWSWAPARSCRCCPATRASDFERLALAFSLICLPQIFFYGVFALLGQILNAKGRFGAFAWAPFVANVVAVAGLLLFIVLFPATPDIVNAQGQPCPGPRGVDRADDLALRRVGDALGHRPGAVAASGALRRTGFPTARAGGCVASASAASADSRCGPSPASRSRRSGFFITQWVLNTAAARRGPRAGRHRCERRRSTRWPSRSSCCRTPSSRSRSSRRSSPGSRRRRPTTTAPAQGRLPARADAAARRQRAGHGLHHGGGRAHRRAAQPRHRRPVHRGLAAIVLVIMILGIVPFGVDLLCYRVFFALEDGRSPWSCRSCSRDDLARRWPHPLPRPEVGHRRRGLRPDGRQRRQLDDRHDAAPATTRPARSRPDRRLDGPDRGGRRCRGSARLGHHDGARRSSGDPTAPSSVVDRLFTSGVVLTFTGAFFVIVYLALAHTLRVGRSATSPRWCAAASAEADVPKGDSAMAYAAWARSCGRRTQPR